MIGSPAWRGAVASVGAARRASLASAPSAVSVAAAASVTTAASPQGLLNRFIMPCPAEMPVRACVIEWDYRHDSPALLSYMTAGAGGRAAKLELLPMADVS